jgi:hypothetical protein
MKQSTGYSPLIIGGAFLFVALGVALAAVGLLYSADSQRQWIKIIAALVSFSGGFLLLETGIQRVQRRFNQAVSKREQELGRSLLPDEREKIRKAIRATVPRSEDPGINAPLMHLIARISLILVPVVLLLAFLTAVGGFLIGLGAAALLAELTKHSLRHL